MLVGFYVISCIPIQRADSKDRDLVFPCTVASHRGCTYVHLCFVDPISELDKTPKKCHSPHMANIKGRQCITRGELHTASVCWGAHKAFLQFSKKRTARSNVGPASLLGWDAEGEGVQLCIQPRLALPATSQPQLFFISFRPSLGSAG